MTTFDPSADDIWADLSGGAAHNPEKGEIRTWAGTVETAVQALEAADTALDTRVDALEAAGTGVIEHLDPVAVATTANITLSGEQTLDTDVTTSASRVLVKDQTDASENGVYVSAAGAWSRATDADTAAEIAQKAVLVEGGATHGGQVWGTYFDAADTLDTDDMAWVKQRDDSGMQDQLDAKADLASPALTGTPTAPTAAFGTDTTQVATTAFVQEATASPSYTVGTLPAAASNARRTVYVSDGEATDATPIVAFSDGEYWRRTSDQSIIWQPAHAFADGAEGIFLDAEADETLWQDDAGTIAFDAGGANDGKIGKIDDLSGNDNHMVGTASYTSKPTYATDGDGYRYILGNGTNSRMATASFDADGDILFSLVAKSGTADGVLAQIQNNTNTSHRLFVLESAADVPARVGFRLDASSYVNSPIDALDKEVVTLKASEQDRTVEIYVNGRFITAFSDNPYTAWMDTGTTLKAIRLFAAASSEYADGRVYGLFVMFGDDALAQADNIVQWQARRYGIAPVASEAGQSRITASGAWTWFNDPRALSVQGIPFIGGVNDRSEFFVKAEGQAQFTLQPEHYAQDDHDNPSFIQLRDGRVRAFWCHHNAAEIYTRVTTNPVRTAADLQTWDAAVNLDSQFGRDFYSYTNPIQLEGLPNAPLFLFSRTRTTNWTLHVAISYDDGDTWTTMDEVLDPGDRPYFRVIKTSPTRLDICCNDGHPNEVTNNSTYHCFYDGAWRASDGTDLGAAPFAQADLTTVYDAVSLSSNSWVWDIAVDATGAPCILFAVFESTTDHRYYFARWDAAAEDWDYVEICEAGGYLYPGETYYSGGIAFDHDDPMTVFAAREISGEWSIWRYHSDFLGYSWEGAQVSRTLEKCFRPVVIRGQVEEPRLAYVVGTYDDYTTFLTTITTQNTTDRA
ncbi:BNR-4 repeat-containing protein [Marinovum algicola]|uniref:BNR-4 repeat-containing protein n=1 Tax=Marinovum algicola TaxID=42444 RepID=UPI003B517ACE